MIHFVHGVGGGESEWLGFVKSGSWTELVGRWDGGIGRSTHR